MRDLLDKLTQLEQPVQEQSTFEIGDAFGISLSEDHEIGTEIVGFVEDGIVIDLDEQALAMLESQGVVFLEGDLQEDLEEGKGPCWVGYKQVGMKKKGGKQVPNCVPKESVNEESERTSDRIADALIAKGVKYSPEKEKEIISMIGDEMQAMGMSPKTIRYLISYDEDFIPDVLDGLDRAVGESGLQYYTGKKKYGKDGMAALAKAGREGASEEELGRIKDKFKKEDHGPEDPEADYNVGEYDREGDMAKDQLRTVNDAAKELYSIIAADENLPEWVQAKITKAMDYLDTARDYMKSNKYAEDFDIDEAKYQGKEVPLGKKLPGDVKKSKVYVRKPNGKIVKVNFGDKKMRIKKSNPARRKSFRARHNCKNPGPRWKARYWSCRSW
jgi:hypothetical protein